MVSHWKQELARDLLALGSTPFYLLVVIRAIIGNHTLLVTHLIPAFLLITFTSKIIKNVQPRIARALILTIDTSLFYHQILFTTFASLTYFALLLTAPWRKEKTTTITRSILTGLLSAALSYVIVVAATKTI